MVLGPTDEVFCFLDAGHSDYRVLPWDTSIPLNLFVPSESSEIRLLLPVCLVNFHTFGRIWSEFSFPFSLIPAVGWQAAHPHFLELVGYYSVCFAQVRLQQCPFSLAMVQEKEEDKIQKQDFGKTENCKFCMLNILLFPLVNLHSCHSAVRLSQLKANNAVSLLAHIQESWVGSSTQKDKVT